MLKAFLICYQGHGLNSNDLWNIALWVDGFRTANGGPTANGGNLTTDGIPTSFYHQSVARAVFGNTIATTNANYQPLRYICRYCGFNQIPLNSPQGVSWGKLSHKSEAGVPNSLKPNSGAAIKRVVTATRGLSGTGGTALKPYNGAPSSAAWAIALRAKNGNKSVDKAAREFNDANVILAGYGSIILYYIARVWNYLRDKGALPDLPFIDPVVNLTQAKIQLTQLIGQGRWYGCG